MSGRYYRRNLPDQMDAPTEFLCHDCQEVVDSDEMGGFASCCPLPICTSCLDLERMNAREDQE